MKATFMRSPLGAKIRSQLGGFNGKRTATSYEVWNLGAMDVVMSALGSNKASPTAYTPQAPTAAVSAVNAMTWSQVNAWYESNAIYGSPGVYNPPGYPNNGTAAPSPAAITDYANYPYGQAVSAASATSNKLDVINSGAVLWDLSTTNPVFGAITGAPPPFSVSYGVITGCAFSAFYFVPVCLPSQAGPPYLGGAPYVWANCQCAARSRYRVKNPYGAMRGIRLNCELHAQQATSGTGPWTDGAAATDWDGYSGVFLQVGMANFSFNAYVTIPNHLSAVSDTTSDWVEVPIPSVPGGWSVTSGGTLLGMAIVDFWGLNCAQWQALTQKTISGIP